MAAKYKGHAANVALGILNCSGQVYVKIQIERPFSARPRAGALEATVAKSMPRVAA